jgi:flagellin
LTVNNNLSHDLAAGDADAITAAASGSSTFQLGADNTSSNQVSISLDGLTQSDLGISGLDLSSASAAQDAMNSIDDAIGTLNDMRGNVGAKMNQLSYHAANLSVTIENVTAAESVIRDVDMAAEMVSFTKYQILQQAGTAMLAQANMAPQSVLSLFGG